LSAGQAADPTTRYAKTDGGRAEIQRRSLQLSRPARNLLLIIDNSRPAEAWLGLVQGAGVDDLRALVDAGLVAQAGAPGGTAPQPGTPRMSLAQALQTKSHPTLSARISAEARPRLGLLKGYKLILEAERCRTPDEIRALAQRFVTQVRVADGDAAAVALAQVLLAPG
jgi:hypothetical protein